MNGHQDDLDLAIDAARAAADVTLRSFGGEHEVTHKSPDQPLTPADLEANAAIRALLGSARPGYGWLSEETADDAARIACERVWVVDPIDGTRSFIAGFPEYAVSIGLIERGVPVLGVVAVPPTGEVFWAVRGGGAFLGDDGAPARGERLHVRRGGAAEVTVLASRSEIGRGEFDHMPDGWLLVPTGSTANKMARVAAGEGDVFYSRGPKSEWDVCAGALIVEEAGGSATDARGGPLLFNRAATGVAGVLASNGALHAAALAALRHATEGGGI